MLIELSKMVESYSESMLKCSEIEPVVNDMIKINQKIKDKEAVTLLITVDIRGAAKQVSHRAKQNTRKRSKAIRNLQPNQTTTFTAP